MKTYSNQMLTKAMFYHIAEEEVGQTVLTASEIKEAVKIYADIFGISAKKAGKLLANCVVNRPGRK